MTPVLPVGGGFQTIVADPPWHFDDAGSRIRTPYRTMTQEELLRLPVEFCAAPAAHLYLWTTDAHLEDALALVRAWGFVFKHQVVWVKKRTLGGGGAIGDLLASPAGRVQIGFGHWGRHSHEACLFAVRGGLPALRHDLPTTFEAPRAEHSRKPDRLLTYAEMMSPGPRLELFARRARPGWRAWGLEAPEPALGSGT